MPAIRPEAISNLVRLSYEFAASVMAFVTEHRAIDSALSTVVDEPSPHEHGVSVVCSQHNLFTRSDEQLSFAPVRVAVCAVVPFIEFKAITVSVLRQPPMPHNKSLKPTLLRNAAYLQR